MSWWVLSNSERELVTESRSLLIARSDQFQAAFRAATQPEGFEDGQTGRLSPWRSTTAILRMNDYAGLIDRKEGLIPAAWKDGRDLGRANCDEVRLEMLVTALRAGLESVFGYDVELLSAWCSLLSAAVYTMREACNSYRSDEEHLSLNKSKI